MKRAKMILAVTAAAVLAFGMTACGSSSDASSDAGDNTADETAAAVDAYTVTIDGTTIIMNAEADPIIEGLGDDYSYFESESCAFEGLDKVYSYSGFKLDTYPTDDVDYVSAIIFMDDTVESDEGITIGSARDDVIEAYGEADEDTGSSLIYEKGDSTMTIGITDDAVSSFEIDAVTE
ncbi:MAG: hypothetical protein LUC41_06855 [Clostridiales bacterium]|nr:hypothetical protein [Clostridiales bacterium]